MFTQLYHTYLLRLGFWEIIFYVVRLGMEAARNPLKLKNT